MKRVIVGCDHAGFTLKKEIISELEKMGYIVDDCGVYDETRCDYPDVARKVCHRLVSCQSDDKDISTEFAVLVCGTGIGMCIVANKEKGIRCAGVFDAMTASYAKRHNHANVLAIGSRSTRGDSVADILGAYVEAEVEYGRHLSRVKKIEI